ncbi:sodium-dependent phosphate transporter 1 [Sitodiplosis mosellana]|uniref:sodium-dependent phosphate transporter 1 n=1 Tax=Sitodiplosis mosellana TaxID=263140 RepID=UPI0024452234|nr:sodium-dependent phosphate transporter 1 [Sitodiplosis mosellana]XP_055302022.1 sodium-dependent phosphate transporter 1 [Sitodiplosis mosellana]XP_055302023.1 sodium-dependent phosphate transporter 1 [Sitodiplosis mosellana]XP_055302024.1 sodium-dependent phosphate transporter 1 [Sitodiplosis mosellana]
MLEEYSANVLWIVILGFIIAFILAFGIGANDVANSFGTSVGSGVLSIKSACLLATVCEISGAILIGYKVSDTMRKGILEINLYTNSETELMLGFVSALASSALWLLMATYFALPISGTHSIVGSTLGFSLVARNTAGIQWFTLGKIVGSWFISPVLSGIMSVCLYWCIRTMILRSKNPLKAGLFSLPLIYGLTTFINVISIVLDGPKLLYMDNITAPYAIAISSAIALVVAIMVQLFFVPWQRREITGNNTDGGRVKFTINDSSESTPSGSPKRNRRPTSLVQSDSNTLPAITEQTELASFNNLNGFSPCFYSNDKSQQNSDKSPSLVNGSYKIDPKIIEKAENLLGKHRSLDNTDLTITSLNFIDNEHQQNGYLRAGIQSEPLQNYFDHQLNHQFSPGSKQGDDIGSNVTTKTCSEIVIPISTAVFSGKILSGDRIVSNNNNEVQNKGDERNGIGNVVNIEHLEATTLSPNSSKVPLISSKPEEMTKVDEPEDVSKLFSFLQILTATFGSFAHGGNDVCNAIGPLIALWMIYKEGTVMQQSETPFIILLFGGIGISIGLWVWGRRVIETVGNDLTKITPSTGFTIEIGSALTVLFASKIGLPISTTHCKVGSVIFVGYASSPPYTNEDKAAGLLPPKPIDWGLFRNIIYAWVVTVPIAAALSAIFMFSLRKLVL